MHSFRSAAFAQQTRDVRGPPSYSVVTQAAVVPLLECLDARPGPTYNRPASEDRIFVRHPYSPMRGDLGANQIAGRIRDLLLPLFLQQCSLRLLLAGSV